jgi:hypothetical protein
VAVGIGDVAVVDFDIGRQLGGGRVEISLLQRDGEPTRSRDVVLGAQRPSQRRRVLARWRRTSSPACCGFSDSIIRSLPPRGFVNTVWSAGLSTLASMRSISLVSQLMR